MNKPVWQRLSYGLLFALYPLLVYVGLRFFDSRWVALLLIVVAGGRLLGGQFPRKLLLLWGAAIAVAGGFTLLTGSELGLLIYPVLVNAVLLILFGASWLRPPTVIETMARVREPDLPAAGVRYTRKLTLVWCLFFVFNGAIALFTVALDVAGQGREWWLLYNGFLAYILIGALFLGEMLFRKHFLARQEKVVKSSDNEAA